MLASVALTLTAPTAAAQACVGIADRSWEAALAGAMGQEVGAIGISPVDSLWGVPMERAIPVDSARSVFVVVAGDGTGVTRFRYVALARRDSLCAPEPREVFNGVRADVGAALEWNEGLSRVAPRLRVAGADDARRLAAAALTFATGYAWDTVSSSADTASGGWQVNGALTTGGGRRLFSVREAPDGRLESLFVQSLPDQPAATR